MGLAKVDTLRELEHRGRRVPGPQDQLLKLMPTLKVLIMRVAEGVLPEVERKSTKVHT
jgi:hypothetical protein